MAALSLVAVSFGLSGGGGGGGGELCVHVCACKGFGKQPTKIGTLASGVARVSVTPGPEWYRDWLYLEARYCLVEKAQKISFQSSGRALLATWFFPLPCSLNLATGFHFAAGSLR